VAASAVTTAGETVTFTYSDTQNGTYGTAVPAFTAAGEHTVYYRAAAENHNTAEGRFIVTIGKADLTAVSAAQTGELTYTGGAQTAAVQTAATSKGSQTVTFTYSDTQDGTYGTAVPEFTAAGEHTVYYRAAAENHNTSGGNFTVTIGKADLTAVSAAQTGELTYTGGAQTAAVQTAAVPKGSQAVTFTYSDTQDGTYGTAVPAFTDAGSHTVYYKAAAENHNMDEGSFIVTIGKADLTAVSVAQTGKLTYTGGAQTAAVQAAATSKGSQAVTFTYSDKQNGTYGAAVPAFTDAGEHTVYYKAAADNHNTAGGSFTVTIDNAAQAAPSLTANAETIAQKADGTITGLTTAMEYAGTENGPYTSVIDAGMAFAPGTYFVRFAAKQNYNSSPAVSLTIAAGRRLTVTLPQAQTGYTLTADKAEFDWHEAVVLTYTLKPGYTQLSNFAVSVNGSTVTLDAQGRTTIPAPENDLSVAVTGVADITAPTGEITVGENKWTSFLNTVTFGLFFKETQRVTITAADAGSGVVKAEYLLSDTVFTGVEQVAGTWNVLALDSAGKGNFNVTPSSRQFIYARLTDADGNFVILNSEGIVLYTSAALGMTAAEFNPDRQADIIIPLMLNGNTLAAVNNGSAALAKGTDYTISGSTLTVSKTYFAAALSGDSLKLTISFAPVGVATDQVSMASDFTVTRHVHTWDGGVITTKPTIGAGGVMTYTCTACGFTRTEPVAKLASSQQTISDGTEKATVSGVLTKGAKLVIMPISDGSGYDTLMKQANTDRNELIGAYEVSLTGQHRGDLVLTFAVAAKYNGKTLTIYHQKKDGTVETFTQTVENGRVSVTVDELFRFLLSSASETLSDSSSETSSTAEKPTQSSAESTASQNAATSSGSTAQKANGLVWFWLILAGAAAAFLLFLIVRRRKKDKQ